MAVLSDHQERIAAMKCGDCRFFDTENRCHRRPPEYAIEALRTGPIEVVAHWHFPWVSQYEWCGEWKPRRWWSRSRGRTGL